MLNKEDQVRARFAPNDPVRFQFRHKMIEGYLVRMNPTRAVVRAGDDEFNVPYELLIPESERAKERTDRIEAVLHLALNLMTHHNLKHWHFKLDHSTRRAGCCSYREKTISIAFDLARTADECAIRDTILHEIAHALVGKKHNHNAIWKTKAKEIGCSGERTHRLQFSPPRWKVTCENCRWSHTAQQRNSKLICRTCKGKLIYSPYTNPA
ncbi:MAG: SprT-like domain-containing protein [Kiritimatiellaceae bacterium]|nr:SprT-like domain-containing protein [Kiritimatiellaceae bacterium]